ncbi:hypothetical protein [Mycobacterium kyorinense]|nr:hypothetical protein [Mycobacterium kyorinense]
MSNSCAVRPDGCGTVAALVFVGLRFVEDTAGIVVLVAGRAGSRP